MKIMYVMLRTMGDVIVSTTICRELKRKWPDAEIAFYVNKPYDQLLQNNADISQIMVSDEWLYDMLFMEMSSGKYDRIFMPIQIRGECNMWHQFEETRYQHLVDFYWQRMGMHDEITQRECYIFPSETDFSFARKQISFDVPRIAIHSTSGVATKDWSHFEELVEAFRCEGFACVQVGGAKDKYIKGAIDFRNKMSLMEIAAFIKQCAIFVGLDSGISYIADAMKTPCIILQGSTSPQTSGPISGRVRHLFVKETGYADCQAVRCHRNCRQEVKCIDKIKVSDVMDIAIPILKDWKFVIPAGV